MYPFNLGFDELDEKSLESMKAPFTPEEKLEQLAYSALNPKPNKPGFGPGLPNFGPGGFLGKPDSGSEGGYGKPSAPPPNKAPERKSVSLLKIDGGSIRGCLYRNTYVWLKNGVDFWFYPVYIGRTSISGFRWTRFGWAYTGVDLSWIDFFQCV